MYFTSYAFDAQLNQRILERFLDLKETAKVDILVLQVISVKYFYKVISLRSFVPIDRKSQNARRSNAIENIFTAKEVIVEH